MGMEAKDASSQQTGETKMKAAEIHTAIKTRIENARPGMRFSENRCRCDYFKAHEQKAAARAFYALVAAGYLAPLNDGSRDYIATPELAIA